MNLQGTFFFFLIFTLGFVSSQCAGCVSTGNLVPFPDFESGNSFSGGPPNSNIQINTVNPISGLRSGEVSINGYGNRVTFGVDRNQIYSELTASARIISTTSSSSAISLCAYIDYVDRDYSVQCTDVSAAVGDKGTVSLLVVLDNTKAISRASIGIQQTGSESLSGVLVDDFSFELFGLPGNNPPASPPTSNPVCGDNSCNGVETCSSCSSDCGACVQNPPVSGPPLVVPTSNGLFMKLPSITDVNDVNYISPSDPKYLRFKGMVDDAVDNGNPDYGFSARLAAYMFKLTGERKYCDYAIQFVETCPNAYDWLYGEDCGIQKEEEKIALNQRAHVSSDSYLYVGDIIGSLAITYDWCGQYMTAQQKSRWGAYANQAIYNVWNPNDAHWGSGLYPWSGWSINDPGNNYFYSFTEATMYWALASKDPDLMALATEKMQMIHDYFLLIPGGGSREGTGYGTSHRAMFGLYDVWFSSTGQKLYDIPHTYDTINYFVAITIPSTDYILPIGDHARDSTAAMFDYHRALMINVLKLTEDSISRNLASWWLNHINLKAVSRRVDSFQDLFSTGNVMTSEPDESKAYYASGVGILTARTDWGSDAFYFGTHVGIYDQSHAHQDQGDFNIANNIFLVEDANAHSHSGIEQDILHHDVLRFEQGGNVLPQREGTTSSLDVIKLLPSGEVHAIGDIAAAYGGVSGINSYHRDFNFEPLKRKLTISDDYSVSSNTQAIFQIQVPVQQVNIIDNNHITAGNLYIRISEPTNPIINIVTIEGVRRIDISGGVGRYVVEFSDQEITGSPPIPPVCGNGVVESGESCDDGNMVSGDGCSTNCNTETNNPSIFGGEGGASTLVAPVKSNISDLPRGLSPSKNEVIEKFFPQVNNEEKKISAFEYSLWFYVFIVVVLLAIGVTIFLSLLKILKD